MKLLRYGPVGQERPGLLDDNGRVRDLSGLVDDVAGDVLTPAGLARLRDIDPTDLPLVSGTPQQDLRLGPCVGRVGKFICIGLNYADHAAESGLPVPTEPVVFAKWTSAICGPDDAVQIPRGSVKTDWEVELGIVIGAEARYLASPDDADAVIAGYVLSHDVSEREFQLERGGQWDKGKSCETFNPLGPWLATADELGDPQALGMRTSVNGEVRQNGTSATMIFGIRHVVWYLSQFMVLRPGDLINTGTPAGVALGLPDHPYLRAGDVVELEIEGLGLARQTMVQA